MTIASEITRLQNDKAAICTAIENKWVTVWAVTLDDYASCIDAIEQGWGGSQAELLLVWWGWSWGWYYWWGGWAWGVIYSQKVAVSWINHFCIWQWWTHYACKADGTNWGSSYFNWLEAIGWWGWWTIAAVYQYSKWCNGWSWGWAAMRGSANYCWDCYVWWWGCPAQGTHGWDSCINVCTSSYCSTWWWWWAWGTWGSPFTTCPAYWHWWKWINVNICWTSAQYAWWWGGVGWYGCYWGWNGWTTAPTSATTPWSWGGGWVWTNIASCAWNWKAWIWIIRYHKDGSDWITCAIGWCKYECWDYIVHKYLTNGWFIVNPTWSRYLDYLVVGWWGWGSRWGWGWWAVCIWTIENPADSYEIVVGAWGCKTACDTNCDGGTSCLGDVVIANWWKHGEATSLSYKYYPWGASWSWCRWWCNWTNCDRYWWGWGWWATWFWGNTDCYYAWNWGTWLSWYWWWGGGWSCTNYRVKWRAVDGGWLWWPWNQSCVNNTPKNCWWWWGGSYLSACAWNGACWVVDICYPSDGSYWFSTATWWNSCYLCWNICVHRFTSNGTFTIVS